ncbi:MAG: hypothetical protein U1E30_10060 [Rhodoblastus sp.]|jgi:hypothetical protein
MPTMLAPNIREFDRRTGRWRERDPLDDLARLMGPWVAVVPFMVWFAAVGLMFAAAAHVGLVDLPAPPAMSE